jgi:hypothetical protein
MNKKFLLLLAAILLTLSFIGVAGASPIALQAFSAGYDDYPYYGGIAKLFVGGTDYSLNVRGFNMVVVDKDYGTVVKNVYFDTYESTNDYAQANSMASFINSIAPGNIVLSAVKDEASSAMTSNAINALYTLGINYYPLSFRGSWAFIGVKGGAQGTATEAFARQSYGPVSVTSSMNPVPVPPSLLLLIPGFAGLVFAKKRFKKI